jgi:oxygen-dependent protoporphyrinogen oxidase
MVDEGRTVPGQVKSPVHGRIVVVGGGISGLAAAHRLKELSPALEVTVLEAGDRVGGLIGTEHTGGFTIELGPDAILTEKPWALDLARRLGLEDQIVRTRAEYSGAYVVARGKLERVPEGFSLVAPARLRDFARTPILSPLGKARALMDLVLPRREAASDEGLESFVVRRFGREVFDRLAQPLVGGIYGADPEALSLAATMPRFVDMEKKHRSLILALKARSKAHVNEAASGARYGLFISFARGNGTLVDALTKSLGATVRTKARVEDVTKHGAGYRVRLEHGEALDADAVIVALPAGLASTVLASVDSVLSARLLGIPYGSAATVTLAWKRADIPHALDAYGFVVPLAEKREILASTWASQKWPGRAPADSVLIRVFFGGSEHGYTLDYDDARLIKIARRELEGLIGVRAEPLLTRVGRYRNAAPHYLLGHRDRVAAIEERAAENPGLWLAGNAYRGVGIPDSIHSGERAAEDAVLWLGERAARVAG